MQENKLKRFIDYSVSESGAITINKLSYDASDVSGKFVTDLQNILILVALHGQEVPQFDPECISCYEISRNQLHLMLGMKNPYFYTLMESLRGIKGFNEEFSSKEIQQLAALCYIVNHRTNQMVDSTLGSMQNRGMISYTERIRYTYRERYQTQTDLTDNHYYFIVQQIEDSVLREQFHLEPDQKYQLFFTEENGNYIPGDFSRWTEYRHACQKAVTEQLNWINYDWVYQIFFYPSEELLAFSEKFSNKSKEELEEILETSLVRVNENVIKSFCKEDTHAFGRYSEDELERLKFTKLIVGIEDFM